MRLPAPAASSSRFHLPSRIASSGNRIELLSRATSDTISEFLDGQLEFAMRVQLRPAEPLGAVCLAICVLSAAFAKDSQATVKVASPDGKSAIAVKLGDGGKGLFYTVVRNGRPIVESSPIDVRLANIGSLAEGVSIEHVDERSVDKTGELPWGKSRLIRD